MVSWDLTIDPKMSTLTSNWIWRDGGSYFGVPMANFLGWYLTVYVFLQAFALYGRRLSGSPDQIPGYWAKPLLAYSSIVIAPILSLTLSSASGSVLDPTGKVWQLHDIQAVTALVGLFTLLPFWLLALFRVPRPADR
jgi:putative membrane protein